MRFLRIAAIALSATQATALSSKDIVAAIDGITEISSKTTDVVKDLEPGNLGHSIPAIIGDFKDIVVLALKALKMVTTSVVTSKFQDSEQTDICKAFHDFVVVHQNLLETVIGQNGLLSKSPISAPLGAVLSVLEGGVDTLADSLLGFVPTCKDQAMKDLKALDDTLDKTIDKLASTVPGAKAAIHAVNGVVKGVTGGVGKLADGIISAFTGSGKGGGLFGGLFSGIFGGGNGNGDSQGSSDGGFFGHLFGGDQGGPGSGGNGQGSSNGGFFGNLFGGNKGDPGSDDDDQGSSQGGFFGHLFGGGKPGNGDNGASGSFDLSGTVGDGATSGSGSGSLSIDTGSSGGKPDNNESNGDSNSEDSGDDQDSQNNQDDNDSSSNSDSSSDVRNTAYNYNFNTGADGVITYTITVLKDKTCRYKSKRKPYSKEKLQELADECAEKFMKKGKD